MQLSNEGTRLFPGNMPCSTIFCEITTFQSARQERYFLLHALGKSWTVCMQQLDFIGTVSAFSYFTAKPAVVSFVSHQ